MKKIIKTILNSIWFLYVNNTPRIIYYHSVHPFNKRSHSIESFKEQIYWLKKNNYICPTIHEIPKFLNSNKVVFITFDDGYLDNNQYVLPILNEVGFKATFFVSTGYMNDSHHYDASNGYRLYDSLKMMNVNDLKNLYEAGMEVGSHGVTHHMISKLTTEEQQNELFSSVNFLNKYLNTTVSSFAYPNGQKGALSKYFNSRAKDLGIKFICSTLWGTLKKWNGGLLPRCEMSNNDTLDDFKAKIRGKRDYRFYIDRLFDKSKVWDK